MSVEVNTVNMTGKAVVMIYSFPGVGKTRFISESPRCLILRPVTDNTDSVRTPGVHEIVMKGWAHWAEVCDWLRDNASSYDWVWVDTLSLWNEIGLMDVYDEAVLRKPSRKGGPIDQGEYGINANRISEMVRDLVAMAKEEDLFNVGFTCHVKEDSEYEDGEGREKLMPYIQVKNMPQKICGYMKVVGHLSAKRKDGKLVRTLITQGTDKIFAKDVYDCVPGGKLLNPTMPKLIKLIEAAQAADAAKSRGRSGARRKKTTANRKTRRTK